VKNNLSCGLLILTIDLIMRMRVDLVIAQFVARKRGYKVEGQIGVIGTYPTQCHHDGEVLSL
jgi:hypothetical protein